MTRVEQKPLWKIRDRSAAICRAEVYKYNSFSFPTLQIGIRFEHQWKMPGLSHNTYHSIMLPQMMAHVHPRFSPECIHFTTSRSAVFFPQEGPTASLSRQRSLVIFKGGLVNNCSAVLPVRGHGGVYIVTYSARKQSCQL